jgi:hypothetical protein
MHFDSIPPPVFRSPVVEQKGCLKNGEKTQSFSVKMVHRYVSLTGSADTKHHTLQVGPLDDDWKTSKQVTLQALQKWQYSFNSSTLGVSVGN